MTLGVAVAALYLVEKVGGALMRAKCARSRIE
jgi:hypothetical protein